MAFVNPSWMPHSVSEAARAGDATADDLASGRAWSHLLEALRKAADVVLSEDVPRDPVDMAAGFRHLLGLLGMGIDQGLRSEVDPVLAVKPSNVDNVYKWGMDCPDCIYAGAPLRGGESYRLWGNRGTAAMSDCSQWRAWRHPPMSFSTSWTWGRGAKSTSSSRRSSTRATGFPSPRTRRHWSCATSSTTGTPRWPRRCPSSALAQPASGRGAQPRTPERSRRASIGCPG